MKREWQQAKELLITAGPFVVCNLGLVPRLEVSYGHRMGKGAFRSFTLELCPAMLNPRPSSHPQTITPSLPATE